ncbi:cytochrome P450 [Sparassis latifolia]
MFELSASSIPSWAAALLLPFIFLLWRTYRPSDSRRAPLVSYWIPWVGSAVDLAKPDAFFKGATEKYGPVFRVKALGRESTYINSPSLINAVYRDNKRFDFQAIRLDMNEYLFSIPTAANRGPHMLGHWFPAQHRLLSPNAVPQILRAYTREAYDALMKAIEIHDGCATLLFPFIIPSAYDSSAKAFFGHTFPTERTFAPFNKFNDSFHLIAAGAPRFLVASSRRAWWNVVDIFTEYLEQLEKLQDEDLAPIVRLAMDIRREGEWDTRTSATALAAILWALEGNAPLAAYWLVALLLQESEGLGPLISEVDEARASWLSAHPQTKLDASTFYDFLADSPLPLLNSTIQETLRVTSSVFSIRRVVAPVEIGGYQFNPGEEIICATRSVHMDEQVHPEPQLLKKERYVGTVHAKKDGQNVPNHSMPFGGGVSMCEGRHFALGELKTFIALLLTYATIERDPSSSSKPDLMWERMGVGIMPPRGDIKVIVGKRKL